MQVGQVERHPQPFANTEDAPAFRFGHQAGSLQIHMQVDVLLPKYWPQLQDLFEQVQSPEYFADLFLRTGAPFTLDAFRLSVEEFRLASLNARAIRERITVLDLADHAGVLEDAVEDALALLG